MSEELQAQLAAILQTLQDGAAKAGDVAAEQLPLLVQEYLRWGLVESTTIAATMLALVVAVQIVKRPLAKAERDDSGDTAVTTAVSWLLTVAFGVFAIHRAMTALQILIAPRVYLLERVSELVR